MRRKLSLASCWMLALSLIVGSAGTQSLAEDAQPASIYGLKRILVLYSYNYNQPAQQQIAAGLESARKIANLNHEDYLHEFLDISPQRNPDQRSLLSQLLLKKYAGQRFDLIITVFDDALSFLMNEAKDLSPDSPCLALYGQERPNLERAGKKVVQSPLHYDVRGTLELALKLFPETHQVLFVSGKSTLDMAFENEARADFASWPGKLVFEFTSDRSVAELRERVTQLPPGTVVMYARVASDTTGQTYSPINVVAMLAASSKVPVFCLATSQLDKGVVGGSMVDVEGLSAMLGRVLASLDNNGPLAIEPAFRFVKPMVNWEQIIRWNISTSRLPPDSVIINRPPTLWTQYRMAVIAAVVVILMLLLFIVALVIENRRRASAESAVRLSEERYRSILRIAMDGFCLADRNGRFLEVNDAYCQMSGYRVDEFKTMSISDVEALEAPDEMAARMESIVDRGRIRFESRNRHKAGHLFDVEVSVTYRDLEGGQLAAFIRDITKRKRAEEERERLQAQLYQAQKMEYVGRLAGGVAHDFNNMLGVILGYLDMIMKDMDPTHPLFVKLKEIREAAERSADLTRQLLAFARKQITSPKVLDLNETVAGMLRMLRRLIGEDIDLAWLPQAGLRPVMMDPSQVDQILANLCVNARDAIDGVGRITIETVAATFDAEYCALRLDCVPGDYVVLVVSDNGCGMDKETQDRIFEPFFTTKALGRGTGLGLSTVYGIVKQNNGFVSVYSEPGKGSTFRVHLPCHTGHGELREKESPTVIQTRGQETVLLAEDDQAILKMTTMMLEEEGYTVLAASTPSKAIQVAGKHGGEIHLLLSDVIMPEMNGLDLAKNLMQGNPTLKCLFMSGYTANVIAHHGVLDKNVKFIQKPFSQKDLAAKVRAALDDKHA